MTSELVASPSVTRPSLRWRLPNAPPIFVGRSDERWRLAAAIERAPVSIVWGLGGLGKTALTLEVVHELLERHVDRALFVSLRTVDASANSAVEITRALCAAHGIQSVDWGALLADEQSLAQTAIDLAEQGAYWLVIDDLHNGAAPATEALLRYVARYARASRWIATSRIDWPLAELEGQRLQLAGLPDGALDELARRIDPALASSDRRRLVEAAAGSPWRMLVALGSETDGSSGEILAGLGAEAIELVHALAPIEVPLPKCLLVEALPGTPSDAWHALQRRGIVEVHAQRCRLHDMARALLADHLDGTRTKSWAVRLAGELASSEDPNAWLEALRLSILHRTSAEIADVLEHRHDALVLAGYASELWRLLEPVTDRSLVRWRMRAGIEIGTQEALALLREPPEATPEELALWAQALFEMGRMQDAADTAKRALQAARRCDDVTTALESELLYLHAQALADVGRKSNLLSMLTTIGQAQSELQQAAIAAKVYALMGVFGSALAIVADILPRCAQLPVKARLVAYLELLATYLSAGRMLDAHELIGRIDRECGGVPLTSYSSRYLGVLRVSVLAHLGRFEEADAIVDEILPYTGRAPVQRPIVVSLRLWLRLRRGRLDGLDQHVDQLQHELALGGNEYFLQWGHVLRSLLDRWHARRPPPDTATSPSLNGAGGHLLRIYRLVQRVRAGEACTERDRAFLAELHREAYLHALGRTVIALEALIAGDERRAIEEAAAAVRDLLRLGNHLYASEAREVLCEALVIAGRREELELACALLDEDGVRFPSSRLVAMAEFFAMAARPPLDPAVLERLAACSTTPTVMRCARALLGGVTTLDAVDRRVIDALKSQSRIRIETLGPASEWRPGWGLDALRRAVWLPDGRRVELADHPILWACLEALAGLGGSASREALVPRIWPGETYNPAVHNNRLNPAIRKLRLAMETDPSRPRRLITTVDGYGFGQDEAVRWLRPV